MNEMPKCPNCGKDITELRAYGRVAIARTVSLNGNFSEGTFTSGSLKWGEAEGSDEAFDSFICMECDHVVATDIEGVVSFLKVESK